MDDTICDLCANIAVAQAELSVRTSDGFRWTLHNAFVPPTVHQQGLSSME